uniref:Nuclear receptor domain-containing protein n=1 Tax=Caenorhabditis tropicalis TaxID=1561998 RepID=A0A1I7UFM5_9PELO
MSLLKYENPLCLVCGNDGNGVHFGVQTCRACAMFYRRSLTQQTVFQCKNHSKFCVLKGAELRLMCKYCRLRKCQEVGMGKKMTTVMNYSERVEYCVWHPITKKPVRWIDVNPIIRRSRTVLEEFQAPPTSLNPLQQLTGALKKLRSGQSFQPKFEEYMTFDDYFSHWEEFMVRAAEWMMHMNQFVELPIQERVQIFKIIWAVWRRFERCTMSARVFGKRCVDEKLLLISDDSATKFDDFVLDVTGYCNLGFDQYRHRFRGHIAIYYDIVSRPCIEWEFSDMEINFALTHIVWRYASRKLLGQTLQAADSILAEISENLHDYYQNELKIENYAPRLAMLMEMVNNVLVSL